MAEIDIESLVRSAASATAYPVAPDVRGVVQARLQGRGAALSLTLSQRTRGSRLARGQTLLWVCPGWRWRRY